MIKDIIVLGGGNAGLMAALYLRSSLPNLNITVLKSTKIGTIGVGEGSTEHWAYFSSATGISGSEIILEAGATLKAGIRFDNWHGDGTTYYHSLGDHVSSLDNFTGIPYTIMRIIAEGGSPDDLLWKEAVQGLHHGMVEADFHQFHFDSIKLNNLFLRKCADRGINVIDADIVDTLIDSEGYVESVVDASGVKYYADFFVDSSGFSRVISSKLGTKWVDWSKHLPMNSAIAFPSPYKEKIPPYTLAKAMSSGWQWRSPVQDRFGNGYVFCDAFITEDEAIAEIQKDFPDVIEIGRKVNFTSGCIDKFWVKNCVSIGLSSNFVEPLEASNISTTVQQSRLLAVGLATWCRGDNATIKHYNDTCQDIMTNILDFIQLHYFTQRNDTDFWKWTKTNIELTPFNAEHLEIFKKNFINHLALSTTNFNIYDILNWAQVMHGLRLFDVDSIKQIYYSRNNHLEQKSIFEVNSVPKIGDVEFVTSREAINMVIERAKGYTYKL